MTSAKIEMLERAAEALGDSLDREVVFVGGATIALWATDRATAEFRPTDDVDVIERDLKRLKSWYRRFDSGPRHLGLPLRQPDRFTRCSALRRYSAARVSSISSESSRASARWAGARWKASPASTVRVSPSAKR